MTRTAKDLHKDAILIDAVCPLLEWKDVVDDYTAGGFTAVAPTVGGSDNAETTLRKLGSWLGYIESRDDLVQIRSAADVRAAKAAGKTGIIFHFQGTEPLEDSLDLVNAYKALGVGIIQLAYNTKNRIGTGIEEDRDSGLSAFGRKVIQRMNQQKVIIDCSHTGAQTTLDAIEYSDAPVVISHANAKAVHDNPRNITDDLARAIAANGGTVGVVGYPAFVSGDARPTLDQFIDHIAHYADLIGPDRVTLGIDYFYLQHPYSDDAAATRAYQQLIDSGRWSTASYPAPPWVYPAGIETARSMENLTEALLRRGFAEGEILGIYGENWLRTYQTIWGS